MVANGEPSQDLQDLEQTGKNSVGGSSKEKERVRIQARPQNILAKTGKLVSDDAKFYANFGSANKIN